MPRHSWRPPLGSTHGICPSCRQWASLTTMGYIKEHRYIKVAGWITGLWESKHEAHEGEIIVRCTGVGRDPIKHECMPPRVVLGTHRWECRCGLRWRTTHGYWKVHRD